MSALADLAPTPQQLPPLDRDQLDALSRDAVLRRYRHWRRLRNEVHEAAFKRISRPALLRQARSLGMLEGKTIVAASDEELPLLYDLAVHTPARSGVSAIDRLAQAGEALPGSDEARLLAALRGAWFSIFLVQGRHERAGLELLDLMRGTELWLMDEGLEASTPEGFILATRVFRPDDFAMSCGAFVPLDRETMATLVESFMDWGIDEELPDLADEPRFPASVYRLALELGLTEIVRYQEPEPARPADRRGKRRPRRAGAG